MRPIRILQTENYISFTATVTYRKRRNLQEEIDAQRELAVKLLNAATKAEKSLRKGKR